MQGNFTNSNGNCYNHQHKHKHKHNNNNNYTESTLSTTYTNIFIHTDTRTIEMHIIPLLIHASPPLPSLRFSPRFSWNFPTHTQDGTQPATDVHGNAARREPGPDDYLAVGGDGRQILLHRILCQHRDPRKGVTIKTYGEYLPTNSGGGDVFAPKIHYIPLLKMQMQERHRKWLLSLLLLVSITLFLLFFSVLMKYRTWLWNLCEMHIFGN